MMGLIVDISITLVLGFCIIVCMRDLVELSRAFKIFRNRMELREERRRNDGK